MHDTPSRSLFKRTRRAYSHGCIRLHRPMKMANFILGRDRGYSARTIRKIVGKREEKVVMLKRPFYVHIDYNSVYGDEEGHVWFHHDIYAYDQAFYDGQLPVEETEEYEPKSVQGL